MRSTPRAGSGAASAFLKPRLRAPASNARHREHNPQHNPE